MIQSDGSADYVERTQAIVNQYEFEAGMRKVRAYSPLHNLLFGVALGWYLRKRAEDRKS